MAISGIELANLSDACYGAAHKGKSLSQIQLEERDDRAITAKHHTIAHRLE
jgi:hypothetical protein